MGWFGLFLWLALCIWFKHSQWLARLTWFIQISWLAPPLWLRRIKWLAQHLWFGLLVRLTRDYDASSSSLSIAFCLRDALVPIHALVIRLSLVWPAMWSA